MRPRQWQRRWLSRAQFASSCLASRGPAAGQAARRIVREDRANHEGRGTAADDRKRNPVHLSIEREADQLDRMGERIPLADIVQYRAAFLHPPERIERG